MATNDSDLWGDDIVSTFKAPYFEEPEYCNTKLWKVMNDKELEELPQRKRTKRSRYNKKTKGASAQFKKTK